MTKVKKLNKTKSLFLKNCESYKKSAVEVKRGSEIVKQM